MPTAPFAFLSLVAGFAVADLTGVRPLGGIVLVVAGLLLAREWHRRAGAGAMWLLGLTYFACFAGSHAMADLLGTWGAVLTVAAISAAASWLVADRSGRSGPSAPSARPASAM